MLNVGANIKGLKQMEAALTDMAKEIGAKKATGMLTGAMRDGGKEYAENIQRNVAVSNITRTVKTTSGSKVTITPGFLKSRIKVQASTNGKGAITKKFGKNVVSVVKAGVFKVPYLVQQEYGTSKQKANPVIRNAFTAKTGAVITVTERRLARRIELARKRIARKNASK